MPSLSPKDRVSLCLFTFTDGRRCRTPRIANHPYFCFFHAQREARAQASEKLAKDLACFFSGDYLSACDLSTALARLIPAVVRGDINPKLARTVAYLAQTLLQAIHTSQLEYVNAFGTEGWRKAVRTSVTTNFDYRFPPGLDHNPENHSAPPPPPSPSTQPMQPVVSSPQAPSRQQVSSPPATPPPPSSTRPSPADVEAALSVARSAFPRRPNSAPAPSAALAAHPSVNSPEPPASSSHSGAPSGQPGTPPPAAPAPPRRQPIAPNRDPYAVHFDHNYSLRDERKLL